MTNRPLRVFLCHSSNDKPAVRELYQKLRAETWIEPWLDEEKIFPGDDWNFEIEKAVEAADMILVCLSQGSITKEGYVQREIRIALDYADSKPEGTLFIIPIRLEECKPPKRLMRWQYEDYFSDKRERGLQRLLVSLKRRSDSLGLIIKNVNQASHSIDEFEKQDRITIFSLENYYSNYKRRLDELRHEKIVLSDKVDMEFMRVPAGEFIMGNEQYKGENPNHIVNIPYDYWMARYTVTVEWYREYLKSRDGELAQQNYGSNWDEKKDHPILSDNWDHIMVFCKWINNVFESKIPSGLVLRLPTEAEWEKAARGLDARKYPWGDTFDKDRCNTKESGYGKTTPVGSYSPQGDSPYGCADMAGNVWEWTHSLLYPYPYIIGDGRENENSAGLRVLRGGSCIRYGKQYARTTYRLNYNYGIKGFRLCLARPL